MSNSLRCLLAISIAIAIVSGGLLAIAIPIAIPIAIVSGGLLAIAISIAIVPRLS